MGRLIGDFERGFCMVILIEDLNRYFKWFFFLKRRF